MDGRRPGASPHNPYTGVVIMDRQHVRKLIAKRIVDSMGMDTLIENAREQAEKDLRGLDDNRLTEAWKFWFDAPLPMEAGDFAVENLGTDAVKEASHD